MEPIVPPPIKPTPLPSSVQPPPPLQPRPFSVPLTPKKRLWPKIAAPLVPVVLVIALVVAVNIHHAKKTALVSATLPVAQVTITAANSISPATILIKQGQSVAWVNQSAQPHQIATDPYPEENKLPGFVEPGPLLSGDSYSFTFTEPGTYTYHDHLNPLKLNGTVIVQ